MQVTNLTGVTSFIDWPIGNFGRCNKAAISDIDPNFYPSSRNSPAPKRAQYWRSSYL